jgi:hypothetical protein
MGSRPVAVVIMPVNEYEIGSKKLKLGRIHEKHALATWSLGNHPNIRF